jgi:hypothetical protein
MVLVTVVGRGEVREEKENKTEDPLVSTIFGGAVYSAAMRQKHAADTALGDPHKANWATLRMKARSLLKCFLATMQEWEPLMQVELRELPVDLRNALWADMPRLERLLISLG